jgi:hypothetical protein
MAESPPKGRDLAMDALKQINKLIKRVDKLEGKKPKKEPEEIVVPSVDTLPTD